MKSKLTAISLVAVVTLTLAAATFWWLGQRHQGAVARAADTSAADLTADGETTLYFPGRGDRLYPEIRQVAEAAQIEEHLHLVLDALLAGPSTEGLYPALPPEIELADIIVTDGGTIYIDLATKQSLLSGMGSKAELLSVYSLVNTTLLNEPRASAVVLLINGRQPLTLAGHVDVTHPLGINRSLIAEPS